MPVQDARIKEVIQRTLNVKSFRLVAAEPAPYLAGQFLAVALKEGAEFKRYLSISSSPTEKGYLEFTKKLTDSTFSKLLDSLRPGGNVKIEYPFGKFTLRDGCEKIAFLSGGIGITPIRSICKYVVDENLGVDIALLYANRAASDIVFREDFELMQKQYARLKLVHVLSEGAPDVKCVSGRITAGVIKDNIADYAGRKFFICGPPAMVEAMKKILSEELSLPKENIITENFQGY